jgi:hypothetical protein
MTKMGSRPVYAEHPDMQMASDLRQYDFDPLAKRQLLTMGKGWHVLQRNQLELYDITMRAVDLTVALDQACRGGQGCLPFLQLAMLIMVFQYDLYAMATRSEFDWVYHVSRFAIQVYSDVVLFPTPETYGVRERLAKDMKRALKYADDVLVMVPTDEYWLLDLWATVMGAMAAENLRRHRTWFLRRLHAAVVKKNLDWVAFMGVMMNFLWWDPMCGEHMEAIWKDSWGCATAVEFGVER